MTWLSGVGAAGGSRQAAARIQGLNFKQAGWSRAAVLRRTFMKPSTQRDTDCLGIPATRISLPMGMFHTFQPRPPAACASCPRTALCAPSPCRGTQAPSTWCHSAQYSLWLHTASEATGKISICTKLSIRCPRRQRTPHSLPASRLPCTRLPGSLAPLNTAHPHSPL